MRIEIIKFYEINRQDEKQHLIGTLHIYLPEIGLNIKGITVFKKKAYWHFRLPSKRTFDQSSGKEVDYACILFDEKEKNEALLSFLKNEGRKFVEDYLASKPETKKLKASPKPSMQQSQSDCAFVNEKHKEDPRKIAKLQAIEQIPQPIKKLASLEFKDPPKKPELAKTTSKFARR